ncbi:hypothetical protein HRbin23_01272 [bacterium HR23]|nr:hypothetical protein HRbin23_01272 [bacterium HR23]
MPRKSHRRGRRPRTALSAPPAGTATLPPKPATAPSPPPPREAPPSSPRPASTTPLPRLPITREVAAIGAVTGICVAILLVLWLVLR